MKGKENKKSPEGLFGKSKAATYVASKRTFKAKPLF